MHFFIVKQEKPSGDLVEPRLADKNHFLISVSYVRKFLEILQIV